MNFDQTPSDNPKKQKIPTTEEKKKKSPKQREYDENQIERKNSSINPFNFNYQKQRPVTMLFQDSQQKKVRVLSANSHNNNINSKFSHLQSERQNASKEEVTDNYYLMPSAKKPCAQQSKFQLNYPKFGRTSKLIQVSNRLINYGQTSSSQQNSFKTIQVTPNLKEFLKQTVSDIEKEQINRLKEGDSYQMKSEDFSSFQNMQHQKTMQKRQSILEIQNRIKKIDTKGTTAIANSKLKLKNLVVKNLKDRMEEMLTKGLEDIKKEEFFVKFMEKDTDFSVLQDKFINEQIKENFTGSEKKQEIKKVSFDLEECIRIKDYENAEKHYQKLSKLQDPQKLKQLDALFKRFPEPTNRSLDDFKEVKDLIKEFKWYKNLGRFFKDEDALELAKNSKIQFIEANKVVQLPEDDYDRYFYFILRGKVGVGITNKKQERNDFFVTQQNTASWALIMQKKLNQGKDDASNSVSSFRSISKCSGRSARAKNKKDQSKLIEMQEDEVFIDGMKVKRWVHVQVGDIQDGHHIVRIEKKPHPIYQRVKTMKHYLDSILEQKWKDDLKKNNYQTTLTKAIEKISDPTKAEIEYYHLQQGMLDQVLVDDKILIKKHKDFGKKINRHASEKSKNYQKALLSNQSKNSSQADCNSSFSESRNKLAECIVMCTDSCSSQSLCSKSNQKLDIFDEDEQPCGTNQNPQVKLQAIAEAQADEEKTSPQIHQKKQKFSQGDKLKTETQLNLKSINESNFGKAATDVAKKVEMIQNQPIKLQKLSSKEQSSSSSQDSFKSERSSQSFHSSSQSSYNEDKRQSEKVSTTKSKKKCSNKLEEFYRQDQSQNLEDLEDHQRIERSGRSGQQSEIKVEDLPDKNQSSSSSSCERNETSYFSSSKKSSKHHGASFNSAWSEKSSRPKSAQKTTTNKFAIQKKIESQTSLSQGSVKVQNDRANIQFQNKKKPNSVERINSQISSQKGSERLRSSMTSIISDKICVKRLPSGISSSMKKSSSSQNNTSNWKSSLRQPSEAKLKNVEKLSTCKRLDSVYSAKNKKNLQKNVANTIRMKKKSTKSFKKSQKAAKSEKNQKSKGSFAGTSSSFDSSSSFSSDSEYSNQSKRKLSQRNQNSSSQDLEMINEQMKSDEQGEDENFDTSFDFGDESSSAKSQNDLEWNSNKTLNDDDLNIEKIEGDQPKYLIIKDFSPGRYFGQTCMKTHHQSVPARNVYIHTKKPTHFLKISQKAFAAMVKNNRLRQFKALMNLLRESHLLKDLKYSYLKNAIEKKVFRNMQRQPLLFHYLYKENQEAKFFYFIIRGNFLVTKKVIKNVSVDVLFKEEAENKNLQVIKNVKEIRMKQLNLKNEPKKSIEQWQLFVYGARQFVGEDDIMLGAKHMTSVQCVSPNAEVLRIAKEDFQTWINKNKEVYDLFKNAADTKRHKFKIYIQQKRKVYTENACINSYKLQHEQEQKLKKPQNESDSLNNNKEQANTQFQNHKKKSEVVEQKNIIQHQRADVLWRLAKNLPIISEDQEPKTNLKNHTLKFHQMQPKSDKLSILEKKIEQDNIIDLKLSSGTFQSQRPQLKTAPSLIFTQTKDKMGKKTDFKPASSSQTLALMKVEQDSSSLHDGPCIAFNSQNQVLSSRKSIPKQQILSQEGSIIKNIAMTKTLKEQENQKQFQQTFSTQNSKENHIKIRSQSQLSATFNPVQTLTGDTKMKKNRTDSNVLDLKDIERLLPSSLQYEYGLKKVARLNLRASRGKVQKFQQLTQEKYETAAQQFKQNLKIQRQQLSSERNSRQNKLIKQSSLELLPPLSKDYKENKESATDKIQQKEHDRNTVNTLRLKPEHLLHNMGNRDLEEELIELGVNIQQPMTKQEIKKMIRQQDEETAHLFMSDNEQQLLNHKNSERASFILKKSFKSNSSKFVIGKVAIPKSNSIERWRAQVDGCSALSKQIDETAQGIKYNHARSAPYFGIGHGQQMQVTKAKKDPSAQMSNRKIAQTLKQALQARDPIQMGEHCI